MKKLIAIIFSSSLFFNIQAQKDSLTSLLNQPIIDCEKMSYFKHKELAKLGLDDIEQSKKLIEEWENACGATEPIFRIKILFDIYEGKDIENIFNEIYWKAPFELYRSKITYSSERADYGHYEQYKAYFGYVPILSNYDTMTLQLAKIILKNDSLSITEQMIAHYYSNNFKKYDELYIKKKNALNNSISKNRRTIKNTFNTQIFTYTNIYFSSINNKMPFSQNIGFKMGTRNFNLGGKIMYMHMTDSLHIKYDNQNYEIISRFGFGFGVDFTLPIIKKKEDKKFGMDLILNPGFVIVPLPFDNGRDNSSDGWGGLDTNAFLNFKWQMDNRKDLVIILGYNYTNFNLSSIPQEDFKGMGLNLGLALGFH